ncbi:hypothetical protein R1flu_022889 [Riccia fluitans]|uniref:Arrestin-like N-terminal domain-containing protein n=1 Tax=Riccia fluitans TaxID=41844 RepID=A0ABD1XQH2_9MARC
MENHPGESRSVSFKAPVGNAEQVFCDLYLTGPKLIPGSVGKTWLKFDVVQVDFGVIPDAQSSDPPSNFIYKADIEFKLSDELLYGCTCVRACPGIHEPELTDQRSTRYSQNINVNPLALSLGVRNSRGISTPVTAFGWLPAFKDPVHSKRVEWKWECRRLRDGDFFHKGRVTYFGIGTIPRPPFDPRIVQYLPQEFKGEAMWEVSDEVLHQLSAVNCTVKITLYTRCFLQTCCLIGYVATPSKVHCYECPVTFILPVPSTMFQRLVSCISLG